MDERKEEVKSLLLTKGWKILIEEFNKKKEALKSLIIDSDFDAQTGVANAKKYQAMYFAVESFEDMVQDLISEEEE